jgi:hypothetical protein
VTYDFIIQARGVEIVAVGATSFVERLADGNIIKTPLQSHHHHTAAELTIEAQIYQRIGPHPRLVPIISWDEAEHSLTMEFMANGTLKDYTEAHPDDVSTAQRLRARQPQTQNSSSSLTGWISLKATTPKLWGFPGSYPSPRASSSAFLADHYQFLKLSWVMGRC